LFYEEVGRHRKAEIGTKCNGIYYVIALIFFPLFLATYLIMAPILNVYSLQTDDQASTAFDREISLLNSCDKLRRKPPGKIPQSKRSKPGLCSKEFSAWKPINHSRNGQKYMSLNGLIGRSSSKGSRSLTKESLVGSLNDMYAFLLQCSFLMGYWCGFHNVLLALSCLG